MAKRLRARGMMHGRVEYRHAGGRGDGTLVDLTLQGCRIKGAPPFRVGRVCDCSSGFPNLAQPVKVDLAAVRWVQDDQFGISFLRGIPTRSGVPGTGVSVSPVRQQRPQVKVISISAFLGSEEGLASVVFD